jgi:hypothetical protein
MRGARCSLFNTPAKDKSQPIVKNALLAEDAADVGFPSWFDNQDTKAEAGLLCLQTTFVHKV